MRGGEDADAAGGVFDDGEDVLALTGPGDGFDDVDGQHGVGLAAEELGPAGGGPVRGAGSMPAAWRISQTVDAATLIPWVASSPWIRRYRHDGCSRTSRRIRLRMDRTVGGRPGQFGFEMFACRALIRSRVPAQHGIRPYDQSQPAQDHTRHRLQQCCQERPVRGREP